MSGERNRRGVIYNIGIVFSGPARGGAGLPGATHHRLGRPEGKEITTMRRQGVLYDVGCVSGVNWRPDYTPALVHRELEIIKTGLHCTAVKIRGRDIGRVMAAAEDALDQGLEVWLSPELWNRSPETTIRYLSRAATAAEELHTQMAGATLCSASAPS